MRDTKEKSWLKDVVRINEVNSAALEPLRKTVQILNSVGISNGTGASSLGKWK